MKILKKLKYLFFTTILSSLLLISCVPKSRLSGVSQTGNKNSELNSNNAANGSDNTQNSINVGNNNVGSGGVLESLIANGRPSVQQLIDPFDGSFKTKVTIPKNFAGMLYLTGLNIISLRDKLIKVRFYLGRENEMIELGATVGRVPGGGIVPSSDIQSVMIDMSSQPFKNVRLLYDLFDYTNYDTDANGVEFDQGEMPVSDAKDIGLYCRGLDLQNDPTFDGAGLNNACDAATGEKCLFSFAKIFDRGLTEKVTGIDLFPTMAQVDYSKSGTLSGDSVNLLKKCLPGEVANFSALTGMFGFNTGMTVDAVVGQELLINSKLYTFNGAYRESHLDPLNPAKDNWAISGLALTSKTGIYNGILGHDSFLFPRYGKMDLTKDIHYIGTSGSNPLDAKLHQTMALSGQSGWMNGCSIRMSSYNETTGENISSCNLTGRIEVVTTDLNTGTVLVLDTITNVKLQIIRASQTDYFGQEVLFTSLKSCNSVNNTGCGGNECCFNNRCWSKDIVAQCPGDVSALGNLGVGATCKSDFECSSLCCDQSIGRCNVHSNTEGNVVLCGKSPGQTCIANEWCKLESVNECNVTKTGFDVNGNQTCALRCYPTKKHGQCNGGICAPAIVPAIAAFDPLNPDCTNAIDPI